MYDQDFLIEDCIVHASFPIQYCKEYRFVGKYVYADELSLG